MSGKDSERGQTRRGFGVILGGLAAGAVLGTTVVAHAEDGDESSPAAQKGPDAGASKLDLANVQRIDRSDIEGLAKELDALKLSDNQRALLVGLLSLATDTIGRSNAKNSASPLVSTVSDKGAMIGVKTGGRPPSIRDQFRDAFIPGAVGVSLVDEIGKVIQEP
jgi:hypothetical protein